MTPLSLTLLGPFQARLGGHPVPSFRTKATQALLIYLAVQPDQAHRREKLMTLLWPRMPQKSAQANLRQTLYQLRQAVPEVKASFGTSDQAVELVTANRREIQLNPAADIDTDVIRFEALLAQTATHQHMDLTVCGDCRIDLEQAATLYQDHFLADFYLEDGEEFEDWAQARRELYQRKVLDALEILTTISVRQKAFAEGQVFAERQLEIDNLRESAYRQLMDLLAHSGRREEALAVYERCCRILNEELGMEPAARTSELYAQIVAGDVTIQSSVAQGVRGFELREEIGEGAYGVIHRAFQPSVGREVAVKVIRRKYANDPEFIRRFEAEAQTVARLEHPFIVPLYDYWRDPEGAYLVMRYVREGSLESALKAGPWGPERAIRMVDQIASALSATHQQGVVHRDLKPANILLDGAGNAYLTDFGIAKDLTGEARFTIEGSIVGTLDYVSPEQIKSERVTPQTDIYSFGAVVYETLTGEKPFTDSSVANLIYSHLNQPIPQVSASRPDLPPAVDDVLQRATAKRPADRFESVLDMAGEFRRAFASYQVLDPEAMTPEALIFPSVPELYNPYKGLRAFQEADADDFFGRDALIEQLVARLTPTPALPLTGGGSVGGGRFLALVGPSGSGKSSAIKAGLIPALRAGAVRGSEKWFVAEMVPGTRPLDELELALLSIAVDPPPSLVQPMERDVHGLLRTVRRILPAEDFSPGDMPGGGGAQLLLVIDQFEELYTLVTDVERRTFFLDSLLAAINAPRSPLRLVITLRADFYDRPLQEPYWGQLLKENTEVILPLSQAELTWSVREPAHRVGIALEGGLAETIVADVADQPGGLPLLQYALTELFEKRQDRLMTREAYDAIGGVLGALGRRAEQIYAGLEEPAQAAARQLFLRLVTLGESVEDTRRRVLRSELQALEEYKEVWASSRLSEEAVRESPQNGIDEVIDAFGQAHLLTFDRDPLTREPTVEVAHEALLREWARLRRWLEESRNDVRMQRMLSLAAAEWEASGRDTGFLLQDARLNQFAGWAAGSTVALTGDESAFLEASVEAQEARLQEEEDRRQRELETAQQLAAEQSQRAEEQSRSARRLRWLAVGLAVLLMLAIAATLFAIDERRRAESASQLSDQNYQLSESRRLAGASTLLLPNTNQDAEVAALLALNALKTDYSAEADVALTQAAALLHTEKRISPVGGVPFQSMGLSPDETTIATGDAEGQVRFWDAQSFQPEGALPPQEGGVESVLFTPDGTQLVTLVNSSGNSGYARLWDIDSHKLTREKSLEAGYPSFAAFSANADALILTEESTMEDTVSIHVWRAEDWEPTITFGDIPGLGADQNLRAADPVDISPNETELVTLDADYQIIIRSWLTGETRTVLSKIPTTIFHRMLAYAPEGNLLAVAYEQGVIVADLTTGDILREIPEPAGDAISRVAFTPSGQGLLVTGTSNLYLFDVYTGELLRRFSGGSRHINPLFFKDGRHFIAISDDGVRLWNADLDDLGSTIAVEGFFPKASDDGSILASANRELVIYESATGRVLKTLPNEIEAGRAAISPDNRYVFVGTGGDPGILRLWDWQSGRLVWELETDHGIGESNYSPDGLYVVTPHNDGTVRLWDAKDGSLVREFHADSDADWFAGFSSDGQLIVAGGTGRTALIWKVATGELLHEFKVTDNESAWLLSAFMSHDSKLLSTVSTDNQLQVWDIADEAPIFSTTTYGSSSRFSHDGRYLGYATENNQIILLDVPTLQVARRIFSSHPGSRRTWFSPDDRYFFVGHSDQTFSRFTVNLDDVVAEVCSRLTRDFTSTERQRYYVNDTTPSCSL